MSFAKMVRVCSYLPIWVLIILQSDDVNQLSHPVEAREVPISFLPLAQCFNHQDVQSWSKLVEVILNWLVNDVKTLQSQEWAWGTDAFWMAAVAANPSFPGGIWPVWDCRIALDGTFIQEWLDYGGRKGWSEQYNVPFDDDSESLMHFRERLWVLFQSHVSSFHVSPIVY